MQNTKPKILILVGPTSSGKSELAVKIAKKFNGEIISCDSRQIYKGMDLGTGKVSGKWMPNKTFVYKSIRHHLIDFINPKKQYSVALFQKKAKKIIPDILKREHLPILCGGTGHWIDAIVYDQKIPEVKPNLKLRSRLEKHSADALFKKLIKLDPVRAKNIDKNNKRRLIRALEIVISSGKPVPVLSPKRLAFNPLFLGLKIPQADLYNKIDLRLKQRLKQGMIKEVKRLHQYPPPQIMGRMPRRGGRGLTWRRLESFGLEYRYISRYLKGDINYKQMLNQLSFAIKHYSQRQITWWKKNKKINWIQPNFKTTSNLVSKFLIHNSS